jgi:short-subunit dehydrogenase
MPAALNGQVVVITGASMGIGEALAKLFAEQGASVVLTSRDAGRAEAARARIGHAERTLALSCDVRNREEIERVVSLTLHNFKRIDVWINNAGYGVIDTVEQMDMAHCRDMFATNLFGAVDAMQLVIPVMRRQGGGTIINVSSVAGHIPVPTQAAYSATKFAMNAMGKGSRPELRGTGVRVMTVCPGYIATNFADNAVRGEGAKRRKANPRRSATAEQVAQATLNGYLKGKREVVVPWSYHIFIKLYQLWPGLVEWSIGHMLHPAGKAVPKAEAPGKQETS